MAPRVKKTYGRSPWGARLLTQLKSMGGRVERGEALARAGKVYDTVVGGSQPGVVTTRVKGRSSPYYTVSCAFDQLAGKQRKQVLKLLQNDPTMLAEVLSGSLPDSLLTSLEAQGVPVLPKSFQELHGDCDCPDNTGSGMAKRFHRATVKADHEPCKHQAALFFQLVEEIDKEPMTLMSLRGLDLRQELHTESAALKPEKQELGVPAAIHHPLSSIKMNGDPVPSPPDGKVEFPALESSSALIIQCLAPSPLFSHVDFREVLREFYRQTVGQPQKAAAKWAALHSKWADTFPAEKASRVLQRADYCMQLDPGFVLRKCKVKITSDLFRAQAKDEPILVDTKNDLMPTSHPSDYLGQTPFTSTSKSLSQGSIFVSLEVFLQLLTTTPAAGHGGSASFHFMFAVSRALQVLFGSGNFIPDVLPLQGDGKQWRIIYRPLLANTGVEKLMKTLVSMLPEDRHVVEMTGSRHPLEGFNAVLHASTAVISSLILSLQFQHKPWGKTPLKESLCFFRNEPYTSLSLQEQSNGLVAKRWLSVFDLMSIDVELRISILEDNSTESYSIGLSARHTKGSGTALQEWQPAAIFLKTCNSTVMADVLKFVMTIKGYVPQIDDMLKSSGSAALTLDQFENFVLERSGLLRALGVSVALPKGIREVLRPKLMTRAKESSAHQNVVTYLNLDGLLEFERVIAIGNYSVPVSEFEQMLAQGRRVFQFRDAYVDMDPDEIKNIVEGAKAPMTSLKSIDIIRDHLTGQGQTVFSEGATKMIESILKVEKVKIPGSLNAKLREYQERGFRWLVNNVTKMSGALLADDMGLGKTIQSVALLLELQRQGRLNEFSPALVVAPSSLLSNWRKEINQFAPELTVRLYRNADGGTRKGPKKRKVSNLQADVVVLSYANVRMELAHLLEYRPAILILDEAQNIKNDKSQISIACKRLGAASAMRLALTGTPVENKLVELHSIFEFCLPGYLGSAKDFIERFSKPIERDRCADSLRVLKQITGPFMLRREKSDREIMKDLPPKIEADVMVNLTATQAALYESVVNEIMVKIDEAKEIGLPRGGLVFKLLSALKQICNHGASYSTEALGGTHIDQSGKCILLMDLLEPIIESGDKVLIFTQFVRMGKILQAQVLDRFQVLPLFFEGSLNRRQRDEMTQSFDTDPTKQVMILSLKAGGVGLNLTQANHVIHFDRWYNPSVENQATDRAFRIGQKKKVFVHRMVCAGTFEEKIQQMIERKRELNEMSVGTGEKWISNMSSSELHDLFSLSKAAQGTETAEEIW